MQIITADIRNERAVIKAMEGTDCVIHCAALIDTNLYPDVKAMQSVNVEGMRQSVPSDVIRRILIFDDIRV